MSPEEELKLLEELEALEALENGGAPAAPGISQEAEQLAAAVDPSMPLLPQVLSLESPTTHPGGEDGAESEWRAGGGGRGVYVYEPPVEKAKEELSSNPQLLQTLFPGEEIRPEWIGMMDENSDIYRAYSDYKWSQTARAAAESGKTAYRYSRMPWLGEGSFSDQLSQVLSKSIGAAVPAMGAVSEFVMGVDDVATFGLGELAGQAVDEAEPLSAPEGGGKFDFVYSSGGQPGGAGEVDTDSAAYTAGQVAGIFTPGGLANSVWGLLGKAPAAVAKAVGGGAMGAAARLATAAPVAAVAGGAGQAVREGVSAASGLITEGDTGTTLSDARQRVVESALDPVNLGLGVAGEGVGAVASGAAGLIRNSPHYTGAIERLEKLGGKVKMFRGPTGTPDAEQAIRSGRARDVSAADVVAERAAPKIEGVERLEQAEGMQSAQHSMREESQATKALRKQIDDENEAFFASSEGSRRLPAVETANEGLSILRKRHQVEDGALRPIGGRNAEIEAIRSQFNSDLVGVHIVPHDGAIEMSVDEAAKFLDGGLKRSLAKKAGIDPPPSPPTGGSPSPGPGPAPSGGAPGGPGVNSQGVNVLSPRAPEPESVASLLTKSMPGGARETRSVPASVRRAVDQVSARTRQAVKKLSADELDAIKAWSTSSLATKGSYSRAARTPEEQAQRMRSRGYDDAEIARDAQRTQARGGKFTSGRDEATIKALDGAMEKLSIENPTQYGSLYRGFSAGDSVYEMPEIDELMKRDTFVNKTPISTTYNPGKAEEFTAGAFVHEGQTPVLLEFKSVRRGAPRVHPDVQSLDESARMGESEVLIPPGSTFKVLDRKTRDITQGGDKRTAHVITLEQVDDAPREAWTDAAMIGAALGIGAATGDEQGAAAASAGGLAMALKKKGIGKVFVTPRRYTAGAHEERLRSLQVLGDGKSPVKREARALYLAALRDRDQRPLKGAVGGWSKLQQSHKTALDLAEEAGSSASKRFTESKEPPLPAHRRLVRYGSQREGELPGKLELERLAAKGGATDELNTLRLLDPLEQLRGQMALRRSGTGTSARGALGILGATADQGVLRLAYPTLNALSRTPLQGGTLGARVQQLTNEDPE
ncbi:MAG TPA: hypothetical protein VKZ49_04660 [Polyangiaceae bacterium]|nr:hypothetical protein [Polyangiaceae bacterium]